MRVTPAVWNCLMKSRCLTILAIPFGYSLMGESIRPISVELQSNRSNREPLNPPPLDCVPRWKSIAMLGVCGCVCWCLDPAMTSNVYPPPPLYSRYRVNSDLWNLLNTFVIIAINFNGNKFSPANKISHYFNYIAVEMADVMFNRVRW